MKGRVLLTDVLEYRAIFCDNVVCQYCRGAIEEADTDLLYRSTCAVKDYGLRPHP
jgi:hypothetical protein